MAGSSSACGEEGSGPLALKAPMWPCALVRNLTSLMASAWCLLWRGTARCEPPQLPPSPGTRAMSHLPLASGPALPSITPVIQAGQAMVANLDCLKAETHSSDQEPYLPERPALMMFMVMSQACLTAGLLSTTRLSPVS